MHISTHLDFDVVAVDADDEVAVLLEITAPQPATSTERPAATLQVVLDRSGSMDQDGRLEGAKRALLALVDRLDPTDNFGLVTFDDEARVEIAAGPLTDKALVRARIRALESGGMTDLSSGYLRGVQEARRSSADRGATLVLISDGHANQGVTDHEQLRGCARAAYGSGVTTSTLGYGLGYDEELLGALSDGGSGSALLAEDADTAGKLLAGEVDGLLAKVTQAGSLLIGMNDPVRSVSVLGGLPTTQLADGAIMVELGDFYAGESRKLLLRFVVPGMAALGLATVAELTFTHVELPSLTTRTVTVPIAINVVPGDAAAGRVANPTVRTELAFHEAQEVKRQASEALRRGDTHAASALFAGAGQTLALYADQCGLGDADELRGEAVALQELADSALSDDANRTAKRAYSSWHGSTRKRGRPTPPSSS